jgi:hypothetical protein
MFLTIGCIVQELMPAYIIHPDSKSEFVVTPALLTVRPVKPMLQAKKNDVRATICGAGQ